MSDTTNESIYTRIKSCGEQLAELVKTAEELQKNIDSKCAEIYQKGFEDGKACDENGCKGCKWENKRGYEEPCKHCCNAYLNQYAHIPKQDDSIKVGDEVTHKSDTIVGKAVCIQIDGDGRHMNLMGHTGAVGYYPVDDFKKTGCHFGISSILEALRS